MHRQVTLDVREQAITQSGRARQRLLEPLHTRHVDTDPDNHEAYSTVTDLARFRG